MHAHVVRSYIILLSDYRKNSTHTNHCVIKMLHRIGYEHKIIGILFQASLFRTLQKVMADPVTKTSQFKVRFNIEKLHEIFIIKKNKNLQPFYL